MRNENPFNLANCPLLRQTSGKQGRGGLQLFFAKKIVVEDLVVN